MAGFSKFINNLKSYGISKKDFEKERVSLSKKFNKPAEDNDVLWSIYNKIVSQSNNLRKLHGVYYEMALFLNKEGKDCTKISQQSQKMYLLSLKESGVVKGVEILADIGCKECKKLHGNKYTLDEALEKMPIPNPNCTHTFTKKGKPFCRCTYLSVTKSI
ncbi:MAG: hypothetical protein U5L76_05560 [Patescibacteria group bacterium]|nr:hypothetical protein [Patescibacteria group bacterium]